MDNNNLRSTVLDYYGASASEKTELLSYNQNFFDHSKINFPITLPIEDEPFVSAWKRYAAEAEKTGLFQCLKSKLAQLSFPVDKGISQTENYRSVTRKGVLASEVDSAIGLMLNCPEELELNLYQSLAGKIPVLFTKNRDDFVSLVRALAMKNEPCSVPPSMGASMVAGLNNWDRIRELKAQWEAGNSPGSWEEEFQKIIPQKQLYQDRFILLSEGPYSGVSNKEMGVSEEEWNGLSLKIRREHECTHYFTRRLFSSMRNNLIDELIADYMGIVAAVGRFRADWFLRFVGLENFPEYREGGRLENYRGKPALSDGAFKILQKLVKNGAENLEEFDTDYRKKQNEAKDGASILISLTHLTLEELASKKAATLLKGLVKKINDDIRIDGKQ